MADSLGRQLFNCLCMVLVEFVTHSSVARFSAVIKQAASSLIYILSGTFDTVSDTTVLVAPASRAELQLVTRCLVGADALNVSCTALNVVRMIHCQ